MKASLATFAAVALCATFVAAPIGKAEAFTLQERKMTIRPGVLPARPPMRDTMYRWNNPYGGYYPGYYGSYYPRYYPGMYWGGSQIFSRPIYIGAYRQCGWVKVFSPWGPRWKAVCVRT
jgi:hypothetical protein